MNLLFFSRRGAEAQRKKLDDLDDQDGALRRGDVDL
jgi:hypothetical protein